MKFYRVETKDKQGPYHNSLEIDLTDWLIMYDVIDNYGEKYEEYMETRPSPLSKDTIILQKLTDNFVFGFNSLEQLYKWFSLKEEFTYFKRYGFHIGVYEVSAIFSSEYQAIAEKDKIKLISTIDI